MLLALTLFAVVGATLGDFQNDYDYDSYSHGHEQKYHGPPAPLKHDGTVDYTPEVKHARAAHFAALEAYKSSFPHGHGHSYHQPEYEHSDEHYRHKRSFDSFHDDGHYYKHFEPAPLNHDGTVADTDDVKHAKAILFKAHAEAKSRVHSSAHFPVEHYPHHEHSDYSYTNKYHGPPAPLNHDGTVAETPEVKKAKAYHFHLYNQFLHRHKRNAYFSKHFEPAPLNSDGTVAETPEVQQAKAAFFAAHAAEAAHADSSWVEPEYHNEPKFANYIEPSHYSFSSYDEPKHHEPSHHFAPVQHFSKHFEPAPLNHDGTVADTPAIQAAKAIHFAAHNEAFSRAAPHKFSHSHY